VGRAQKIIDRLDEIGVRLNELTKELQKAGTSLPPGADFNEMMGRLPYTKEGLAERQAERQRLIAERVSLQSEYEKLPAHLKTEDQ
jgi:predicted nuclease with TOPRIM domain